MKKQWVLLLVLVAGLISGTTMAQTPPMFMLVNKIEENASYLGQLNREPFEEGEAETEWAPATSDRANLCLQAYVNDYYALARLSKLRRDLEQDVMRCMVWFEDLSNGKKLDFNATDVAKMAGEDLQKRLKTVQSLGLQEKVTITVYKVDYDFNKLKELGNYTALAVGKQYD